METYNNDTTGKTKNKNPKTNKQKKIKAKKTCNAKHRQFFKFVVSKIIS